MNKLRTLLVFLFCAAASAQTINGNTGQSVSGVTSSPAYVTGGGTANAQTATYSPAISAWTPGLQLCWLPIAANTTSTPTFAPNGLAAKTITKNGTSALVASDITTTAIACGTYDGTGLQLQNPQTSSGGSGALTLISTLTPTGVGTVTFSSLGSYRDLIVVVRGAGTAAASFSEVHMQFNSDTGSNYDLAPITVNNTSLSTTPVLAGTYFQIGWVPAATGVTNMGAASECTIFDYAGTTFQKAIEARSGIKLSNAVSNFFKTDSAGWWRNTAAITSVTVFLDSGNYATGSSVSLYGRN